MKKVILFVAVIAAFSFASCKKDRTCTCTTTYSSGGGGGTQTYTIIDARKGDAKKACISYTEMNGTVTQTTTCTLN